MVGSRRCMVVLVSVFLGIGVAACAKEIEKPNSYAGDGVPSPPLPNGGGGDGGRGEGGVAEGGVDSGDGGDAGACNVVPLTGVLVDRIGVVGDPPVSTGGIIADGSYDLTLYSAYVGAGGVGGPTGLTAKATLSIAAGKIDQVLEIGGSSPLKTTRTRSAYTTSAATFATTELCPNTGGGASRQYTATDVQIILTDLVTKEAFTFAKR